MDGSKDQEMKQETSLKEKIANNGEKIDEDKRQ